ncbi:MAG: hypothetical protein M1290_03335 [Candidatus Thermoplasmatota archaeon]|jgi:hypothetical protein|nr:hypothetical protein [Candidatus Thermoplasmatota archaeon]MCL5789480.1 hypothetical protein [Candidatus Thermoplasmatota archaeon]
MTEFDSEMVVRFQDMRSPISYFSKVYGFNGYLNFYNRGTKTDAVVTYLREGKTMDDLRKAIRSRGFEFVDRKAGVTIEVGEECYVCEMIESLLKVNNALIDVPIFVTEGDIILRIKYFKSSSELQRIVFRDSEKRDFFSIDYLGPIRNDKDWLLENAKGWEMKKLVFYVVPTNSFTLKYAKSNKNFKAKILVRSVDKAGFLNVFYQVDGDFQEWEGLLQKQAKQFKLVHKGEDGVKVFYAIVPEEGILIDPYKLSEFDLPFNYSVEISGDKSKVTMFFEKSSLDTFFKSIGKIKEEELLESQLEIKSVERYP